MKRLSGLAQVLLHRPTLRRAVRHCDLRCGRSRARALLLQALDWSSAGVALSAHGCESVASWAETYGAQPSLEHLTACIFCACRLCLDEMHHSTAALIASIVSSPLPPPRPLLFQSAPALVL